MSKNASTNAIGRALTFHCTRHTAASHLVMAGVDLRTVPQILGHRTLQMTLRYAHLAPGHLQDAARQLGEHTDGHFMRQVDEFYARRYEGTGLGLVLTKRLFELHGCSIWVESEEGKGSIFTFTFPRRQ